MSGANETQAPDGQPIGGPKTTSLLKSSAVMAIGTTFSRGLGFLRTALLLAALGAAGANDAFNVANTLPNAVFNLLAAGLMDAILVPQIVKAFKKKSGSTYVNRLLTLAGLIMLVLTLIMVALAGVLVNMTAGLRAPAWKSLAIVFAVWCLPQIFFYGVYALLGQFLNARGVFGPYMWTPAVNNVIAIVGLIIFIAVYGTATDIHDPTVWNFQRTALMAGPATLGVIAQALLLIIPLRKAGVKLRLDFHFRSTGLGQASKIAGWVFATLIVGQLGYLSTSNIAAAANAWSTQTGNFAASTAAMSITFTVYMLPQSIVSLSIATALFTRIAAAAADGDTKAMLRHYQMGVRSTLLLVMWLSAILGAAAVPIFQILGPTNPPSQMAAYANALVIMLPGLLGAVVIIFSQRVFYSMEDGRPVFTTVLIPTLGQIVLGWTLKLWFLPPVLWLAGALVAETISRIAQGVISTYLVRKHLPESNPLVVVKDMIRYGLLALLAGMAGMGVLHFVGPFYEADSITMRVLGASLKAGLVFVVVTAVYIPLLAYFDRTNFQRALALIAGRVPQLRRFVHDEDALATNRPEAGSEAVAAATDSDARASSGAGARTTGSATDAATDSDAGAGSNSATGAVSETDSWTGSPSESGSDVDVAHAFDDPVNDVLSASDEANLDAHMAQNPSTASFSRGVDRADPRAGDTVPNKQPTDRQAVRTASERPRPQEQGPRHSAGYTVPFWRGWGK